MANSAITGPVLADNKRAPAGTAAAPSFAFNDSTGTGAYLVSPNVFGVSTAGLQRVVVDASGNIGIGTGSPAAKLDVVSTNQPISAISARYNLSNAPISFGVANSNGYPYIGWNTKSIQSSDSVTYDISNFATQLRMDSGEFKFYTAPTGIAGANITFTQALRVSSGGVNVKDTLDVAGNAINIYTYRPTTTATDYLVLFRSDVGGAVSSKWRVEADGDTISSTGSYTSDERAKKNFEPIKYGLKEVLQLQPKSFNWWHEENDEVKSFCVSTAQEVQAIMPEMVRDDGLDGPDGEKMKAIYDKEIAAILVKAIQEQQAMIEDLKAEIEKLKVK